MVEVKQSKIKTALLKWALESKTKEVNRYDPEILGAETT